MTWFRYKFCALLSAFRSKRVAYSSDKETPAREENMYFPFAEAMNCALEQLSDIQVEGIPEFKTHIAFVPCSDKGVKSDRSAPGSSFKPDIALMSLEDACEYHGVDRAGAPQLSEFITGVAKVSPSGSANWKNFLSAVEVKRRAVELPPLGFFDHSETQVSVIPDVDQRPDDKPDYPPPVTCKIDLIS